MKRCANVIALLALCAGLPCFAATQTALLVKNDAMALGSVQEALAYIRGSVDSVATNADKRSLLYYEGTLEESVGLYSDAMRSYAQAAGIAANDADGMPKASTEHIVLCAVRASLCAGEYDTADSYLNSAVRASKDPDVIAYINLYSVWSSLCRAPDRDTTRDAVALLKAYSGMDSMKGVRAPLLFTLWYLTDDNAYSDALKAEFPHSPEYAVTVGRASVMSVPFWYFVPRAEHDLDDESANADKSVDATVQQVSQPQQAPKRGRQQVGFFASKANADALIARLKQSGFDAYHYTETRASGTTYYVVVVDENADGTMGRKLRDAGFECYPVD